MVVKKTSLKWNTRPKKQSFAANKHENHETTSDSKKRPKGVCKRSAIHWVEKKNPATSKTNSRRRQEKITSVFYDFFQLNEGSATIGHASGESSGSKDGCYTK